MNSHSDKDVWEEVRKAERLFGDEADDRIADHILKLTLAEDHEKASFWSAVAVRLKELHAIKLPNSSVLPTIMNPTKGDRTT